MAGDRSTQTRKPFLQQFGDWVLQSNPDALKAAQQLGLFGRSPDQPIPASTNGQRTSTPSSASPKPTTPATPRQQASPVAAFVDRLNRNPVARYVAGDMAAQAGVPIGVARGGVHAVQGAWDALNLASRLMDPYDAQHSRPGEAAWDQVIGAGTGAIDYAKRAVADPQIVKRDALGALQQANIDLNPYATPMADNVVDEFGRNFNVGMNQGELGFNVGTLAFGGAPREGLAALSAIGKAKGVAKYLEQGFTPAQAARLAEPYRGMGHHYYPRRDPLPPILGGGPVPKFISDSPFNVLKPRGMDTGEFYELHYKVDPHFKSANFGRDAGGGVWKGKDLGLKKYGTLGNVWYGAPHALRQVIGTIGGSSLFHDALKEDGS